MFFVFLLVFLSWLSQQPQKQAQHNLRQRSLPAARRSVHDSLVSWPAQRPRQSRLLRGAASTIVSSPGRCSVRSSGAAAFPPLVADPADAAGTRQSHTPLSFGGAHTGVQHRGGHLQARPSWGQCVLLSDLSCYVAAVYRPCGREPDLPSWLTGPLRTLHPLRVSGVAHWPPPHTPPHQGLGPRVVGALPLL